MQRCALCHGPAPERCNHCGAPCCDACFPECCARLPCATCHRERNWALRCFACHQYLCDECAPRNKVFARRNLCRWCKGRRDLVAVAPLLRGMPPGVRGELERRILNPPSL